MSQPPNPPVSDTAETSHEIRRALSNGLRLLASFAASTLVAVAVRFWLPRLLGPDIFGILHFSEQFAAAAFALLTLGVSDYIRKEVSLSPQQAAPIFGALITIRTFAAVLLCGGMAAVLWVMDKSFIVWAMVYTFALGQLVTITNNSFGAMLEAQGQVRELALTRVGGKLLWGIMVVGGLIGLGHPLVVAVAFCLTEGVKLPILASACRRHLNMQVELRQAPAKAMLIASAPYLAASLCRTIYARIDVTMISAITNDAEVGWYGAAGNVSLVLLLLMPILNAVVLPMGSRLAARSREVMNATMRRTSQVVLMALAPAGLLLALNAHSLVVLLYGEPFAPAALSLIFLAPMAPITYLCTLGSAHLIQLDRVWTVAKISAVGLVLNPAFNALAITPAHAALGDGGAGLAAAAISLAVEFVLLIAIAAALGRQAVDRDLGWLVLRVLVTCGLVTTAHLNVPWLGTWRILFDAAVYLLVGSVLAVVPVRQSWSLLQSRWDRWRRGTSPASG